MLMWCTSNIYFLVINIENYFNIFVVIGIHLILAFFEKKVQKNHIYLK